MLWSRRYLRTGGLYFGSRRELAVEWGAGGCGSQVGREAQPHRVRARSARPCDRHYRWHRHRDYKSRTLVAVAIEMDEIDLL